MHAVVGSYARSSRQLEVIDILTRGVWKEI